MTPMHNLITVLNDRQCSITEDDHLPAPLPLPRFNTYTICNLRGGIGKTSLAFNLAYLAESALVVDTCPQCNLTWFFDNNYLNNVRLTVYDMLLPSFVPGLGTASHIAKNIAATNPYFEHKQSFYIPSDSKLYFLPSQIMAAMVQAKSISGPAQTTILDNMLFALRQNIEREMKETNSKCCLIDTSPFFSGATHLAWHSCDALIVPVRTDQQSINSVSLLLDILSNPASEFRKIMPSNNHTPKIQLIILTHCGWSTVAGSVNRPNQQTRMYVEKLLDIIRQHISQFTTDDPTNHLLLCNDFLGSGRIASASSKPIELLQTGDSMHINRVKTVVNASVEKVKRQLKYIHQCIW